MAKFSVVSTASHWRTSISAVIADTSAFVKLSNYDGMVLRLSREGQIYHDDFYYPFGLITTDQRIEVLRKDQRRYCLPDEVGNFSLDQFIKRWMDLNRRSLYGKQVPFRQLRSVCISYIRIITMIERMDDRGQHAQQAVLSVFAFILAAEAATLDNDQNNETTAIGRDAGLSCQEYRQKVTGRSIFDGLVSRSALKSEARFPKRTKLNTSEGLQGYENTNWRAPEKLDFSGAARSVCNKSRRTKRSSTSFRASDGGHVHGGLRAYRATGKQEYQRAALAYQPKLQAESFCASCARV